MSSQGSERQGNDYRNTKFYNGKADSKYRTRCSNSGGRGEITKDMLRYRMLALHQQGLSMAEIAADVKCNKSTVSRTLARLKETGSLFDRSRSGRPRKSTAQQDRFLIDLAESDRWMTSVQLKRKLEESLQVKISDRTVRRKLLENGLTRARTKKRSSRTKPLSTLT